MMPSFSTSIIYLAKNIVKPKVTYLGDFTEMQEIIQNSSTDVTETRNCLNPLVHS